jgi:tetratricopeptide (TPR) repeat protein
MELVELLQLMSSTYNKEELRTLCFELDIDYEDLAGEGKKSKVRELIREMRFQRRLLELFDHVMVQRPWLAAESGDGVREQIVAIQEAYKGKPREITDPFAEEVPVAPFQAPPLVPYFTGRQQELSQLKRELTDDQGIRIVGLVGFAGVGKSAIAIQPMHDLQADFPDGILWANLDVSDPETELANFAAAFGQAESVAQRPDVASKAKLVRDMLAHKKCLVVLDQARDSEQVKWLLPSGRENHTLITTRNRKMLSSLNATILPVEALSLDEGVAYLEHAVGRERVAAEPDAARRIVHHVGGLMLPLSIVAGFLVESDDLTLAEYEDLLQDEQTRLENLADWEDENRDVTATFELSYQSLPAPFQKLFATLALFGGPDFCADAVAAVTEMPPARIKLGLNRLFMLSLVSTGLGERDALFPVQSDGKGRYRINPLLRLFAQQKLGDEVDELAQRATAYYTDLAVQNRGTDGYEVLDFEWRNILASLQWAHETRAWSPLCQGALALTHTHLGTMGFLDARGRWAEARRLLAWASEGIDDLEDPALAIRILTNLGGFAARLGDAETAASTLQRVWALLDSSPATPEYLVRKAYVCTFMFEVFMQRDRQAAGGWAERLRSLLAEIPDEPWAQEKGYLFVSLSGMFGQMGQLAEAQLTAEQGLDLLPESPTSARVVGLINLGLISRYTGNYGVSTSYLQDAIDLGCQLNNLQLLVKAKTNLATGEEIIGAYRDACASFRNALQWASFMGDVPEQTRIHNNLGLLNTKLGDDHAAGDHLDRAISLATEYQMREVEAQARVNLAALQLLQARPAGSQQQLDRAKTICQELHLGYLLPELHRLQAQIHLAIGDLAQAQASIDESLQQPADDALEAGISWRVQGEIYSAHGQMEAARSAHQNSLDLLEDQEPYELARSQLALGKLHRKNEQEQAKTLLQSALNTFTRLGAQREIIVLTQELVWGQQSSLKTA